MQHNCRRASVLIWETFSVADTWESDDHPKHAPIDAIGWFHAIRRGVPLLVLIFGGLIILLLMRLIEIPIWGLRRPFTPFITQFVCRNAFWIMGIRYKVHGEIMRGPGAVVSNHVSWLDIFALNAAKRIYFVSKAEVAAWPGIGWLARATGTVFIKRDRRDSANQISVFQKRLEVGHKVLFFPEGTSTDGLQVLAFKPTLFAAFFSDDLRETMQIQPVTLQYTAPIDADPRFYGWWGNMDFGPHLLTTLSARHPGAVSVRYHPPVHVRNYEGRKDLSSALEGAVRAGLSDDC
ncbi:MAG: 1-acyl-sn-glycerol-3-phosphate acyltransferase [Yoonia sp.]|jgi:1-acyl-sn-glycerol-3-phosphate acyltransferase